MTEFFKGVCSVALGAIAGAGLAAVSFLAVEVLMPPVSHLSELQTHLHPTDQSTSPVQISKPLF